MIMKHRFLFIALFFAVISAPAQSLIRKMEDFSLDVRTYVYVPYHMEHDDDGQLIAVQVRSSNPKTIKAWVAVDEFEFPTLGSGKITTDIIIVAAISLGKSTITVRQLDEQRSFEVTAHRSIGPPMNPYELKVYPNPVTGNILNIGAKTYMEFNELGYRIYDPDGNRVISESLEIIEGAKFVKEIDINKLQNGLYAIRIYLNGHVSEQQFIRQ